MADLGSWPTDRLRGGTVGYVDANTTAAIRSSAASDRVSVGSPSALGSYQQSGSLKGVALAAQFVRSGGKAVFVHGAYPWVSTRRFSAPQTSHCPT
jgi:hypothetical protein